MAQRDRILLWIQDDSRSSLIRLYTTADGRKFNTLVEAAIDVGYPNETSLVFLEDDRC